MNYKLILTLTLLLLFSAVTRGSSLKLIKSIGSDDHDDYIFMRVADGILAPNKDIYIVDTKGHFLARYDWNGKFIKKIGQRGQGPEDFNLPRNMDIVEDRLFIEDALNARIVEVDLELENMSYHKLPTFDLSFGDFAAIGKTKFVTTAFPDFFGDRKDYIRITNFDPISVDTFFDQTSFPINYKASNATHAALYARVQFGIHRKSGKMLIVHVYPNNPIRFFVYSLDGECLDTFTYTLDKNYRLPDFIPKGARPENNYTAILTYACFIHKNHYVAIFGKFKYENRRPVDEKNNFHCLIFDAATKKLKHRFHTPNNLEAFRITDEGYLLGTNGYDEVPKLYIYKLEF